MFDQPQYETAADVIGVSVRLTNREMAMGAECGIMRNIAAMADDRCDQYGFAEEFGWNAHIEGACGEVAAGKIMGRFWSPTVNTFAAPDIGRHIQVRTRSRHDYDLPIRPKDKQEHLFVLVTGKAPLFMVRGYILAADARRDEWLADHGGRPSAWFVPQRALLSIHDLMLPDVPTGGVSSRTSIN